MQIKKKTLVIILVFLVSQISLVAQNKRLISGNIIDAATKEPLPYVTVSLKKLLIGVVTNEEGKFDLYIPENTENDTLLVNYLGYKHVLINISEVKETLDIKLEQTIVQLEEIVIRPLSPENYIQMAMRKVNVNYPKDPFQTTAYYRERTLENNVVIKNMEGIFKTFYETYLDDTMRTQNQLLLFRKTSHPEKVAFMARERNKLEIRDSVTKEPKKLVIDLTPILGGPSETLESGNISKNIEVFLDTNRFRSYKYSFAKSSSYNTNELIVIDFSTKGKVDGVRESGKIYIDLNSLSIVKIESRGDLVGIAPLKSFFFLLSVGFEIPSFEKEVEFQPFNGRWYPKNIRNSIHIKLTNNHMFRPDEYADFEIEQFLTVNELKTINPTEVPLTKRFNVKEDMEKQIYNDDGITWDGLNIIKK